MSQPVNDTPTSRSIAELTDDPKTVANALRRGEVVALPTDTVYGFAASLTHANAIQALYDLKARPDDKPIPVLLADQHALALVTNVDVLDPRILNLTRRFWPGALTIAVPGQRTLPGLVQAPDGTVGVRVPDHSFTQHVLKLAGGAAAVTSANRSGTPPLESAQAMAQHFNDHSNTLLKVIAVGPAKSRRQPSTVIGFAAGEPQLIRAGGVDFAKILAAWRGTDTT